MASRCGEQAAGSNDDESRFFFQTGSRPAVDTNHLPIHVVQATFTPRLKLWWHEPGHSPPMVPILKISGAIPPIFSMFL
jgi:hypothetical protein